jgi:hypothetical protein
MKTVAAISFLDNHSLSMDVEGVNKITLGAPIQLDEASWCCELLIRTTNGTVALQLVADSPDQLKSASFGV